MSRTNTTPERCWRTVGGAQVDEWFRFESKGDELIGRLEGFADGKYG